jgi:hypothetical protein
MYRRTRRLGHLPVFPRGAAVFSLCTRGGVRRCGMENAGWWLSALWFLIEWPRPYSEGMWVRQRLVYGIVFLVFWLWA